MESCLLKPGLKRPSWGRCLRCEALLSLFLCQVYTDHEALKSLLNKCTMSIWQASKVGIGFTGSWFDHQLPTWQLRGIKTWVDYYSLITCILPITTNYKFMNITCISLHAHARDCQYSLYGQSCDGIALVSFRVSFDLCAIEALPVEFP